MKTVKPSNMVLFFKANFLEQKNVLSINTSAIFNLNSQNQQLIEAHELMKFLNSNLAEGEIFDLGVPKPRAEFLVYGSCYAAKPVTGIAVQVSVGNMTKNLVVIGNRQWTYLGASAAEEFTSMPVNYKHAFGGEGYAYNPLGKGYAANSKQLPNVEDPDHPIVNKSDHPQPVSFNAYPLTWPQRMKFVATVDDNYLQESWPHLPKGTDPEYFNTAPFDQRVSGFFRGDEKIIINNMHPDKASQHSQLPGLRARVFVVQKITPDQEVFKEVISRAETLWLFPNQDAGILLYRANVEVADEDFSDVSKLYAVWEKLSEPPQSLEFYLAQLHKEVEAPQQEMAQAPIADASASPKVDETVAPAAAEATAEFKPEIPPEMVEARKELEKVKARFDEILKKSNTDAETVLKKFEAQNATPNTTADLNALHKQFEAHNAELMKKTQLTAADVEKLLAKNTPQEINLDAFLLKYSKSNLPIGEFIDKLKDFRDTITATVAKNQKDAAAAAAEKAETPPEPEEVPPLKVEEPVLRAKQLSVADVLQRYKVDKNLSQLDLTGLDFSKCDLQGADFSHSILDKTIFKDAKLDQAIFNHSRLNDADFSNSSLNSASFSNSLAQQSKFCQANLSNSTITNSDFSKCNFDACILDKANLAESIFEHSSFNYSKAVEVNAINDLFAYCNLSNADFSRANLTKSDFSNAVITQANFSECHAPELTLNGVTGTSPCFQNAYLTGSRASKDTLLNSANFKMAQLDYALWEGAQLPEVNLTAAVLDYSNFRNCFFNKATLELALAKNTNFAKAQFVAGNLNRINLFKGSLRRANLSAANLSYSNLYGVDFYKVTLGNTNFKGSNLKRTLLTSLGVELDSTY